MYRNNKIDQYNKPAGYRLNIPTGWLGNQNHPHFYMRVVPKYQIPNYGSVSNPSISRNLSEKEKAEKARKEEEFKKILGAKGKIVSDETKIIAELRPSGTIIISTKEDNTNSIHSIDAETWSQFGKVLLELMKKFETGLDCHNFFISSNVNLGSWTVWEKEVELSHEDDPRVEKVRPEIKKFCSDECYLQEYGKICNICQNKFPSFKKDDNGLIYCVPCWKSYWDKRVKELEEEVKILKRESKELDEKTINSLNCSHCQNQLKEDYWINKTTKKSFCSEKCYNIFHAPNCDNCRQKCLGDTYYADAEKETGTLCEICVDKEVNGNTEISDKTSIMTQEDYLNINTAEREREREREQFSQI